MAGLAPLTEDDSGLVPCAAWLHRVGRPTRSEGTARSNVPDLKAHRPIARAGREGAVRVSIDGRIARRVRLEQRLRRVHGLGFCEVAPDVDDDALSLRARLPRLARERGSDPVVGLRSGRALAACLACLPNVDTGKVRFVSLLGGVSRWFAANPFDGIGRLVARTGAEVSVLSSGLLHGLLTDERTACARLGPRSGG